MTIMVASPWQAGPRWARVAGGDESWLPAVPRSLGRQRVRRHSENGGPGVGEMAVVAERWRGRGGAVLAGRGRCPAGAYPACLARRTAVRFG